MDKYFSAELTSAGLKELQRQAGILEMTIAKSGYAKLVEQVINSSFRADGIANVQRTSLDVSSRIESRFDKLLVRSVTMGRNPKQLAPELSKFLTEEGRENTKFNTQRLMVTETTRVQSGVQKESYLDADIEKYGWVTEPNACRLCKSIAAGGPYLVREMEIGVNMMPVHPFDRCSTYPIVDREAFEKSLKERGL